MNVKSMVKDIYPLTPIQEWMLYNYLPNKDSGAYFIQFHIILANDVDIQSMEKSLDLIVEKYDVLRSSIVYQGIKSPRQIIFQTKNISVNYQDITDLEPAIREEYIDEWKAKDKKRGFDLTRDPLTRMNLFKTGEGEFVLIWSFHHIIVDSWSGSKIVVDFFDIYNVITRNQQYICETEKKDSFKNYVEWLAGQNKAAALSYWSHYLNGYDTFCRIPGKDWHKREHKQFILKEYLVKADKQMTHELSKLADSQHVTFNALMQTVWGLLLQRYNRSDDVVFGFVESVRPTELTGIEDMIGAFMNIVPFRVTAAENESFIDILNRNQQNIIELKKYSFLSLAEIQESSSLKHNMINSISVFQNYPLVKNMIDLELFRIEIKDIRLSSHSNYDFSISFIPGEELSILVKYNSMAYSQEHIQDIIKHLFNMMNSVIDNAGIRISDIEILDNQEKEMILNSFNQSKIGYPEQKTICELFEEQVLCNPDKTALQCGRIAFTYRQLNEKANQLGNYLKENYAVKPNDLIGIMLENSPEAIIAIMGILKSGGAYVPFDPDYPEARIEYMIDNAMVKLMIISPATQNKISKSKLPLIDIADLDKLSDNRGDVMLTSGSKDLVYVIYTSGSTGSPKGVMIEQKGLVNYIYWAKNFYLCNEEFNFPLYSSLSFDLTVTSIFTPLISGNRIIIYSGKSHEVFQNILREDQVGIMKLTPTHLKMLPFLNFENKNLKKLIVGGEDLKTEVAQMVTQKFEHPVEIYNEYGPTETVVGCAIYKFDLEDRERVSVLIGKPIANVSVYILDQYNRPVPIGVPGELCIGGDGVARGYLNNKELNEQKFIKNPYSSGMIYKTGDYARWLQGGNLDFLGRMDEQVKIRGFRVELGEIEKVLLSNEKVSQAVAAVKKINREQDLAVYVVLNEDIADGHLVKYMERFLPRFMIPPYIVRMPSLPLTQNGKVDKKALPDPVARNDDHMMVSRPDGTVGIDNQTEAMLWEIWKEILGQEHIGMEENFFSIGGHSLKVTELAARIQQVFHLKVSLETIFINPTIRGLAQYIDENIDKNA